jgi:uncharacterized protein (TIGR04141 family)
VTAGPKRKFKYSFHLAAPGIVNFHDFLTENAKAAVIEVPLRAPLPYDAALFLKPHSLYVPDWGKRLDTHFHVDGKVKSASTAGVLMVRHNGRVLACAFGHGHALIDEDKRENDFGLIVAANSLSDENVRLVEKANLGSVIRDATQAAGITNLQEFNVDRALSLVRKLSGNRATDASAVSGASSVTTTSEHDFDSLHVLADTLLKLYESRGYQKTAFAIIDKIKPVLNAIHVAKLDDLLVDDLKSGNPSFELGAPDISSEPIGYLTISGVQKRKSFADITLEVLQNEVDSDLTLDDLHRIKIVTHSADGAHRIREWSIYRGLVGSLEVDAKRYALNEGKWYAIEDQLRNSANSAFAAASKGLDAAFLPWPVKVAGKKGKTPTYEREEDFNARVCATTPDRYIIGDQNFFKIPGVPGKGFEICDIFDVDQKRLIHVKKSGRRSSVISHFINQGMNSAKALRTYGKVKNDFLEYIKGKIDPEKFQEIETEFPHGWTVELKFGDAPTHGKYAIPFFSRVTLDESKREIEALGFKAVEVSFIRLSKAP